ncbi:MAG TPA: Gfo/Idh/MocA family oxidoreductase, partial [Dongiaceae bacterium]
TERIETSGHKQAEWRTDPKRTGAGGSIGDIGTHAFHLASFVSGLELDSLLADLTTFVPGRQVDDNANVLLRFKGGAKGMLWASQVAPGNENALRLRVFGTKGGLSWSQENPNYLWYAPFGEAPRQLSRGGPGLGAAAGRVTRVPPGHPEGYLEGFASIYSEVAQAIRAAADKKPQPPEVMFPTVEDGLKGVSFVDAVVRSSRDGGVWTKPA